jgi:hypothetical protein
MGTAEEWLDRVDTLTTGATEGPWSRFHTHHGSVNFICPDTDWYERQHVNEVAIATLGRASDAQFIAASRTLLPQAVAALRAVLKRHYRTTDWGEDPECGGCEHVWPCPTVRAINKALR